MTFTEIVDRITDRLGIPATAAASIARIGRSVNDIYREVTTSIGLDLSRQVIGRVGTTSLGSQTVTFSNIEKIHRITDNSSGPIRVLSEVTLDQLQNINPATGDTAHKWAVESWTASTVTIRFDTIFQTVFDLSADGYMTVATLAGDDTPAFPESFHDILIDGVLIDEYLKQEKTALSDRAQARYEKRISDLRMWRAKTISLTIRQAETKRFTSSASGGSGGGSGSGAGGNVSYTQIGLITFDRDPAAPFAVTSGSAMVANLDAELLQGLTPSQIVASAGDCDGPASATDNAIARFDGATGKLIQNSGITIADAATGTLSGSNSGDVSLAGSPNYLTIAAQVITRALIDLASHVTGRLPFANFVQASTASILLGRRSGTSGDFEQISLGTGLSITGTVLSVTTTTKPFIVFTAAHNQPPATNYATPDTRNNHLVLDFDGSTDEEAIFSGVLPTDYAAGGLTCELWVAFTSATSGTFRFQASIERDNTSFIDIDSDNFITFQSGGGTAPSASGQIVKVTITFSNGAQMGSLAAGEAFRLKIRRDADGTSGTDDITTDAELLRVVLRET